MSRENVELVREGYRVIYDGRSVEGFEGWFAQDFRWHQRPEFPGRRVYRVDELPQLWADLDGTFAEFSVSPEVFEEVGDYVIAAVRTTTRLRGSTTRIEAMIYHVWHVRDGVAHEAWAYADRDQALAAAGLS